MAKLALTRRNAVIMPIADREQRSYNSPRQRERGGRKSMAHPKDWSPKQFHSVPELRAELDRMKRAHEQGALSTSGGWTVGQNLEHCAKFIKESFDGFTITMPIAFRLLGSTVLKPLYTKPKSQFKPGIKAPKGAANLMPSADVSIEEGLTIMDEQLTRIESGEQMTQPSPLFGKLSNEQWVNVHLSHCRMHFGFLKYPE
jgi:hypothetical protein